VTTPGLGFVGGEKNLAVFLIECRDGSELGFLLLLHRAGESCERGLGLFVGEKKFAAAESVLDATKARGRSRYSSFEDRSRKSQLRHRRKYREKYEKGRR